jgi:hypothetical protein
MSREPDRNGVASEDLTQAAGVAQARFESMLAQVLTTDEEVLEHQAAKGTRMAARRHARKARATFERNRAKPLKPRRP